MGIEPPVDFRAEFPDGIGFEEVVGNSVDTEADDAFS